jgi:hypothetical protein
MNYKEKNELQIEIITGDKKVYKPIFIGSSFEVDTNTVPFEFSYIKGAYVESGEISFRSFPMEIYFQGDNHLDEMEAFIVSSEDRNNWIVVHPYYGNILCRPSKITVDNDTQNVSKITFSIYETIELNQSVNAKSIANFAKESIKETYILSASVPQFDSMELDNTLGLRTVSSLKQLKVRAVSVPDFKTINEKINKLDSTLNTLGVKSVQFMNQFTDVIKAPVRFLATINNRVDILKTTYNDLKATMNRVPTLAEKEMYELLLSLNIIALCEATLVPVDEIQDEQGINLYKKDYMYSDKVLSMIQTVIDIKADYLNLLTQMSSTIDNQLDSYYPDPDYLSDFNRTVGYTIANLYLIAVNGKVERNYILKKDTNLLDICSRLYGDISTDLLNEIIENNSIPVKGIDLITEGSSIRYFI